jgi:hypothetical protein
MAPDLITVRDHRRPRLYRTTTIEQEHHRAVNIPGARGQRPRPLMTRGEAAPQQVLGGATLTVGNVPRRSRRPCAAFLTAESIRPGDDHPHPSLAGLPPRCSLLTNGGRSSPRLAATQLPSITEPATGSGTDLHRANKASSRTHPFPRKAEILERRGRSACPWTPLSRG